MSVGFGYRDDYPHLGASPISAADWKGNSIVACVFSEHCRAEQYLDKCRDGLVSLGTDEVEGYIYKLPGPGNGVLEGQYVAVLIGYDICAASEYCRSCEEATDEADSRGLCGRCAAVIPDDELPDWTAGVGRTPIWRLHGNMDERRRGTPPQLGAIRAFAKELGLEGTDLVRLAIRLGRVHVERDGLDLDDLTFSEVGGLFEIRTAYESRHIVE